MAYRKQFLFEKAPGNQGTTTTEASQSRCNVGQGFYSVETGTNMMLRSGQGEDVEAAESQRFTSVLVYLLR